MTENAVQGAEAPFTPDWKSTPGNTILDLLEEHGWAQHQLADQLGYSLKQVDQLIRAEVPLTEDTAIRLQNAFGVPAGFWLTREAQYRKRVAALDAT